MTQRRRRSEKEMCVGGGEAENIHKTEKHKEWVGVCQRLKKYHSYNSIIHVINSIAIYLYSSNNVLLSVQHPSCTIYYYTKT